jgi:hypothetical protein
MPSYSLVAPTELTDFSTTTHFAGRVAELSHSGCYVFLRKNPPPVGTELRVCIYVRDHKGMGVLFSCRN